MLGFLTNEFISRRFWDELRCGFYDGDRSRPVIARKHIPDQLAICRRILVCPLPRAKPLGDEGCDFRVGKSLPEGPQLVSPKLVLAPGLYVEVGGSRDGDQPSHKLLVQRSQLHICLAFGHFWSSFSCFQGLVFFFFFVGTWNAVFRSEEKRVIGGGVLQQYGNAGLITNQGLLPVRKRNKQIWTSYHTTSRKTRGKQEKLGARSKCVRIKGLLWEVSLLLSLLSDFCVKERKKRTMALSRLPRVPGQVLVG